MRFYWPIAKTDAARRMVWGYASTEAEDSAGETVKREALAEALDDYMRFANIREMHQPSAVGIAEEAAIDEHGLYIAARIVDGDAWAKVLEGVYKGFSIGGRVTARDPANRKIITGLELSEISVVDRPANPEAVFDCWKRVTAEPAPLLDGSAEQPRSALRQRLEAIIAELCDLLEMAGGGEFAAIAPRSARSGIVDVIEKREPPDPAPLAKLAGDLIPRLDALQQRVEAIARTPLPPQTAARGFASVSKREDGGIPLPASEDIVTALARMTEEERTLTLIKAAHANPIRPNSLNWRPGESRDPPFSRFSL